MLASAFLGEFRNSEAAFGQAEPTEGEEGDLFPVVHCGLFGEENERREREKGRNGRKREWERRGVKRREGRK